MRPQPERAAPNAQESIRTRRVRFMMDQTMNNDTEYLEAANAKLDAIEAWADEALHDADV